MEYLSGEAKDRVRAMSLYLVGALVVVGVAVGAYALLVGFDRVSPAAVDAVARTGDPHDLVVQYVGGTPGCGDPERIDVDETTDDVVVTAFTVARHATRQGFGCGDVGVIMVQTVRLAAPLDGREVRDGARDGAAVVVHDSLADLLEAS
ncbi:hypothetical protein [Georgenia yuyongxinii]|uniref:Uncharacterized protein n=1 Tax=Georgenia yuyongxinii TaxID=2589797 RepID=A0A552WUX8_9MICO|nr:hypothetical protein [Georgenia yuyongxinii]TRW46123.1 hypothetical protein FJ693_06705 [Georgenia yuyongxinii]